jgi:hypothetical protein
VASTVTGGRAVVELLAHLTHDGREVAWPVTVVAETLDELSVVFRTYYSQWPITGRHHIRHPILKPGQAHTGDVVGRYQAALDAGDAEAIVRTFASDGYFREPSGPQYVHRGTGELRSFFTMFFSAGGGIGLQHCTVTDDGVRCAPGIQLRPLGEPRSPAPGGNRHLRAWPGRPASRGPRLRRCRSPHRATPEAPPSRAAGSCGHGGRRQPRWRSMVGDGQGVRPNHRARRDSPVRGGADPTG